MYSAKENNHSPYIYFDAILYVCCVLDSLEDGFSCPEEDVLGPDGRIMPHPTYAHPEDCQKFYICRNGVRPQRGACPYGKVYSEDTYKCEDAKDVQGWWVSLPHLFIIE